MRALGLTVILFFASCNGHLFKAKHSEDISLIRDSVISIALQPLKEGKFKKTSIILGLFYPSISPDILDDSQSLIHFNGTVYYNLKPLPGAKILLLQSRNGSVFRVLDELGTTTALGEIEAHFPVATGLYLTAISDSSDFISAIQLTL